MSLTVIAPHFSCVVSSEEALKQAIEENYCDIYIISSTGMYRRTGLTHGRHVTVPCMELPGGLKLPKVVQDVSKFYPAGKIPIKFLHEIVAFFKAVMVENKGANLEAQAFVIWNPEQGYHIRIPEQTVSAAAVSYDWASLVGANDVVVLDIHSHNNMGAFFSGTDDKDDNGNCTVSGVVGKLSSTCEMVFRFNLPGNMKIKDLPISQIFEEAADSFEVPKEWTDKVKRHVPAPYVAPARTAYGANSYGQNSQNSGGVGTSRTPGGRVVANGDFRGANGNMALVGSGLSQDNMEVLEGFGYPFPNEGEESLDSFPSRPHGLGRQHQKRQTKKEARLLRLAASSKIKND